VYTTTCKYCLVNPPHAAQILWRCSQTFVAPITRIEPGVVSPLAGTLVLVVHDSLSHRVCHTALPEIPVAEGIRFFPSYLCDLSASSPRQAITVTQSDMSLPRSAGESEKKKISTVFLLQLQLISPETSLSSLLEL
jgi:hypothetical protein